jgi:hypothetical protein
MRIPTPTSEVRSGLYYNIAPLRGCRAERSIAASVCRDPSPISKLHPVARAFVGVASFPGSDKYEC